MVVVDAILNSPRDKARLAVSFAELPEYFFLLRAKVGRRGDVLVAAHLGVAGQQFIERDTANLVSRRLSP